MKENNSCEIGLTIRGKFKNFNDLSKKQKQKFKDLVFKAGLNELPFYKNLLLE